MTRAAERLPGTDAWVGDGQGWLTFEQAEGWADELAALLPGCVVIASHRYERHQQMDLTEHRVHIYNTHTGGHHWFANEDGARLQWAALRLVRGRGRQP